MKIKTVLVAGLAAGIGYVFGTKAGRAQFEQIRARANDFAHSPKVQETVSNLSETVKQNAHKLPDPVADVVSAVADRAKGSSTGPASGAEPMSDTETMFETGTTSATEPTFGTQPTSPSEPKSPQGQ